MLEHARTPVSWDLMPGIPRKRAWVPVVPHPNPHEELDKWVAEVPILSSSILWDPGYVLAHVLKNLQGQREARDA